MPAVKCSMCNNKTLDPRGLCHIHANGSRARSATLVGMRMTRTTSALVPDGVGSQSSSRQRKELDEVASQLGDVKFNHDFQREDMEKSVRAQSLINEMGHDGVPEEYAEDFKEMQRQCEADINNKMYHSVPRGEEGRTLDLVRKQYDLRRDVDGVDDDAQVVMVGRGDLREGDEIIAYGNESGYGDGTRKKWEFPASANWVVAEPPNEEGVYRLKHGDGHLDDPSTVYSVVRKG